MKLLERLFKREPDHEQWLAQHPGKDSRTHIPVVSAAVMQESAARTRQLMEAELEAQRSRGYIAGPR
jgi:urease accessory protein UreF